MIFFRLFLGYLVQVVPFCFLCFYPFQNSLRWSRKASVFLTAGLLMGSAFLFSAAGTILASLLPGNHILFQSVNLIFLLCLIFCLFWYIYAVRAPWQKKLFIFSFSLTAALSINSICTLLTTWIYLDTPSDGLPYIGYSVFLIFGVTMLFLPLMVQLLKHFYFPIAPEMSPRESGQLSVLSLILFLVLASGLSFLEYTDFFENLMALFLFFALLVSAFLIYLLYFKMYSQAHEKYLAQKKYLKLQYDIALLDRQYRQLNQNIENSRRIRHDLRHHMLILQGYLTGQKTEMALEYIQQYLKKLQDYELVRYCSHPVVNLVVSYYASLAENRGISFSAHIQIPEQLDIETADLSVLLGNLLENAVDAAASVSSGQKQLLLNIVSQRRMLVITVDNSFCGSLRQTQEGSYLSTKSGHEGIGLKSVRDIAEKYNGGAEFHHRDESFHASVMLGLQNASLDQLPPPELIETQIVSCPVLSRCHSIFRLKLPVKIRQISKPRIFCNHNDFIICGAKRFCRCCQSPVIDIGMKTASGHIFKPSHKMAAAPPAELRHGFY